MSVLSIDYGSSKIGLAKSDDTKILALPLEVLPNTSEQDVLNRLQQIISENNIDQIIVGLPVGLGDANHQSDQATEVLAFIDKLKSLSLPIEIVDERLSTKQATQMTKGQKGDDDDVAAMIILQNYLDSTRIKD